jgi:hypothetical protein
MAGHESSLLIRPPASQYVSMSVPVFLSQGWRKPLFSASNPLSREQCLKITHMNSQGIVSWRTFTESVHRQWPQQREEERPKVTS